MSAAVRWIDNHCHLDPGADGQAQLDAARSVGVERVIDVGTDVQRSRQTIASAAKHPGTVFATVGVHPHDASEGTAALSDLLREPGVVAVGECGLDYHYDHSPRDVQRTAFAAQVGLAHSHGLPLVIHSREAWDDTFAVLDTEGTPAHTVFHCFTGGPKEAEMGLARGAHISFSGIITFKNADEVRAGLAITPVDRVMVETDSPYLAPLPFRGKRNSPSLLPVVGERMAEVLDMDVEALAERVWATTHEFYSLPVVPQDLSG